ncbi:MAPEG family protein [Sphingomonas sp.]|uniref:MAPEG family protein n=1 Tax=Sphingomonas sp. TaxID=28214 RepID=UPI001E00C865|nr:MAPEG family protein [Sphingomonas sp.]MBX9796062.1 MAPEG family protein [Sphingomonas sp.]
MSIAILPVTLTAAGAAALINLWLAIRAGASRSAIGGGLGDGGNARVLARTRAHANFAEYTPFVLILIAVIELAEGTSLWLAIVSGAYFVARLAHPFGMDGTFKQGRFVSTIVSLLVLLGLGGYALSLPYRLAKPAPVAVEAPPSRG